MSPWSIGRYGVNRPLLVDPCELVSVICSNNFMKWTAPLDSPLSVIAAPLGRTLPKYPLVPRYFVAVHHMPTIPLARQDQVQAMAAQLCRKWSVPVIDIYGAGQINTFNPEMAARFSYNSGSHPQDGDGTHLNARGYQRYYTPMLQAQIKLAPR